MAADAVVSPRRTVMAGALVAVSLLGDSYLYAVLPLYHAEVGLSLIATGWVLSANRYVRLLTNPLAGAVGASLGWGAAFAAALWAGAAATAGYGLLTGAGAFLALRALWGLCWSFLRLGGLAAVLADSPPGRRGALVGLFAGISRLGSLVGVAAGGYLADRLGFRTTAVIFAAISATGAVIGTAWPAIGHRWRAPETVGTGAHGAGLRTRWLPLAPHEWAVSCLGAVVQLTVSGLVMSTLALLLKERLGLQVTAGPWVLGIAAAAGLLLGTRFVMDLLVAPTIGHWADRSGRARVLTVTTAGLVAAIVALSLARSWPVIAAVTVLLFAAGAGTSTVLDAWAGDLAGRSPGRFLPVYNSWLDLGAATGPIAGYYLVSGLGLSATYAAAAGALTGTWLLQRWLASR